MKKVNICLFFFVALFAKIGSCQQYDLYSNYRLALQILSKSIETHGGFDLINAGVTYKTKGSIFNFGHYSIPNEKREFLLNNFYLFSKNNSLIASKRELTMYGNTYESINVLTQDSVFVKEYFETKGRSTDASTRGKFYAEISKVMPSKFLLFAFENRNSLSLIHNSDTLKVISFTDSQGKAYQIEFNSKFQLTRIQELKYSDLYGDFVSTIEFIDYRTFGRLLVPSKSIESERLEITGINNYADFEFTAKTDSLAHLLLPKDKGNFIRLNQSHSNSAVDIERIGKNLYLLNLTSKNNKVLVAEYKDHFNLLEAPIGFDVSNAIMKEISRIGDKPLKNIFVSHHHPDHAGGLKWFVGRNINIVTTTGNIEYLKKNSNSPHTLSEIQNTVESDFTYQIVPAGGSKRFVDLVNDLIVYEISDTDHTAEYLVFYFRREKLLFIGDLATFPLNQKVPFSGQRGISLINLINREKLLVDKIYTSWPLQGQKKFGTIEELKSSIVR